jgi:hypothetical protein
MPVPVIAGVRGDLPRGDLQRGEQRGRAGPLVVVGAPLGQARGDRQHRRGPVQRLDLALLVHAHHHRLLRRSEVEPDHVPDLRIQLRIGGELERLGTPGLQPVLAPDVGDSHIGDPHLRGQQPRRPVRDAKALRRTLHRPDHHLQRIHHPRPTGTPAIGKPGQTVLDIPGPPRHHRLPRRSQPLGDRRVRLPTRGRQHDPCPQHRTRRRRRRSRPGQQQIPVGIGEQQRRSRRHKPSCRPPKDLVHVTLDIRVIIAQSFEIDMRR